MYIFHFNTTNVRMLHDNPDRKCTAIYVHEDIQHVVIYTHFLSYFHKGKPNDNSV